MGALGVEAALLARGRKLSPPASPTELAGLSSTTKGEVDSYILSLYSTFNGFEDYDQKSQIDLWPIEKISRESGLELEFDSNSYMAVGDILIDSDFIMLCPKRQSADQIRQFRIDSASISLRKSPARMASGSSY